MAVKPGAGRRLFQTIGSIRTGIILLIVLGIASALGTIILQRPATETAEIERAYSPQTLRLLDAAGLTDVYHAWWYVALLALVALSIILVSIDRFPNAWRYYSRPYRRTDGPFRAVLPLQVSLPINDPGAALIAAEKALKNCGLKPERVVENDEVSLYAEKSRYAVMAVYVVHASLLLIFLGGIIDALYSYKGYLSLVPGRPGVTQVETRDGKVRKLPFELRCDGAGQENYTGEYAMMPKRWWSDLTVLQNGREVLKKQIVVNDPLVFEGVRFYQSGYGESGELKRARIAAVTADMSNAKVLDLAVGDSGTLQDGTTVKLTKFLPDAYVMDGDFYLRSKDLNNPAAQVEITTADGKTRSGWLVLSEAASRRDVVLLGPADARGEHLAGVPFQLVAHLEFLPFTGLQVSHEPGQWAVWAGCLLMGAGLVLAFWVLHQRYWVVPVTDKQGRLVLWVGAAANKNREGFAVRFREIANEIEKQLQASQAAALEMEAAATLRR